MFKFEVKPPFRNVRGRFISADQAMQDGLRDTMRDEGRRYVGLATDEAPKRSGKFAKGIRFRTFVQGNTVGFSVSSPQPLSTYITEGTRPHVILPRRRRVLAWKDGSGSWVFARKVRHPGTKRNRFHSRAYRRWLPGARSALGGLASKYVRYLQSDDSKSGRF